VHVKLGLACTLGGVFAIASSTVSCDTLSACDPLRAGESSSCPVPGWLDRSFDIETPSSWNGRDAVSVVFVFHGGGGNKDASLTVTCPGGDSANPGCFDAIARSRGLVVVRADGTGTRPATNVRTWNSSGGVDGLNCASGGACESGVDDVAYFDALFAEVSRIVPVDPKRVFLTGLSNGGSITYRLACERGDRVAAVVAVGSGNQFAARVRDGVVVADPSVCKTPLAVLDVHGTDDACWEYPTGGKACIGEGGLKIGVAATLEGWRMTNGCETDTPTETPIADVDLTAGTRSFHLAWNGCRAPLEHIRIEGGGHTWPNGHAYLAESVIGRVPRDFGSERLVNFLVSHPKP